MANRPDLQTLLEEILGTRNVYFQPPESVKMNYPAIVYGLDDIQNNHADDGVYLLYKCYSVTLVDKNADSKFVDTIAKLQNCQFERHFKSENLNHWVFSLYF
nr:MAG TPA_asm: tail completion protein [Caudoviricetes sp.]